MNRQQRRAGNIQTPVGAKTVQQAVAEIFTAALEHSKAGRSNQVVACFRKAIKIAPDFAAAHYNLGNALAGQEKLEDAIPCFRKAIALSPGLAEAHCNLGAALKRRDQFDEAAICCRKAIELAPHFALAHFNLGTILESQRRLEEAAACYREAADLRPYFAEAHLNLAMMLLTMGDMEAGWQAHEWRWKTPQMIGEARNFPQPQWRGEATEGKTLLIHSEQGFGDTIQFCRFAPLASARGLRVIMQVPKPLIRLLQTLPGVDCLISAEEPLPLFDLHAPMMSLPWALGTILKTIPSSSPYLQANTADTETWAKRLAPIAGKNARVGLVWAGNSRKDKPALVAVDRLRSVRLKQLAPLFECPGIQFFSLQKDEQAETSLFPLTELMADVGDFADTAALITNLDLIISVDTAVAHLAGALGKPVWLLNRFNSDWRWMDGRRDSPWYPTLKLYQQPRPGDWDSVIAEISNDLHRFANGAGN